MERQEKRIKRLPKSEVLQPIKLDADYSELKEMVNEEIMVYFSHELSWYARAVDTTYYFHFEEELEENGMEKFCLVLFGLLFEIEYESDRVDKDLAYSAYLDIKDFETGYYDNLFTKEDLAFVKADVEKVKKYFKEHPDVLAE